MALSQDIKNQFFANALGLKPEPSTDIVDEAIVDTIRTNNITNKIGIAQQLTELKDSGVSQEILDWVITGNYVSPRTHG